MEAARAAHEGAGSRQREREETLNSEIARLRVRLDRAVEEQLDAPTGSETARLLREKAAQIERALGRLMAERAQLAAPPSTGLSEGDAQDLAAFAAEIRSGTDHATGLERRRIFQLLKLTGSVRRDDVYGIRLASATASA